MPANKPIMLPKWLTAIKKDQKLTDTLFNYVPALMHWRNEAFMFEQINAFTPHASARKQIQEVWEHLKEVVTQGNNTHPLVSKISMSERIPQQLLVSLAPDVDQPPVTGVLVLRIDIHGDITGVEREYSVNFRTK